MRRRGPGARPLGFLRMRTAVLGAGALGLTAAYRLAQQGDEVVVLEREPIAGGLAAGFEIEPGMWLEKFYHHLFRGDRHAIGLIHELGLGSELVWRRPLTVSLRDGAAHQLDSPMSLLRFSPLRLRDRVRMGAALAYIKATRTPDRLEGQTAADWIQRRMGQAAYDVVWGPLLRGKFGATADQVAMPWFWARVHDRTPQLGYLQRRLPAPVRPPGPANRRAGRRAAVRDGSAGGPDAQGTALRSRPRTARSSSTGSSLPWPSVSPAAWCRSCPTTTAYATNGARPTAPIAWSCRSIGG